MADRAEVVIVGGGIVGCATAYLLARKGVPSTIIEKESVGSCASGFSAGLLNPINGHGIPGPLEALARESFQMHLRLASEITTETGIDPEMRALSWIWLAFDDAEVEHLRQLFQWADSFEEFPARWLDGREVTSMEPRLSPKVLKALHVEGVRQVDSYRYTLALAQAAEKYGATIRQGTVEALMQSHGRVSGVVLEGEEVACESVVLAMGPWTGQVASWLGIPVPIEPLKGQIVRLELEGPPLEHTFYHSDGGYVAPKPDGLIWVGTTEERVGFDDSPTTEARDAIIKDALKIMPILSEARVARQTACLRPLSEDGMPIIGAVPGWEGVYLASGAGRKGILLGPAMASAIADLVTTGHTDLSIEPFSPGRFVTA